MRRRMGVALAVVLVASGIGVVGGVNPVGAGAKPTITPTGDLACSGGGKFKAISANGSMQAAIRLKMSCTGSTGHPAVTLVSGKASPFLTSGCSGTGRWAMSIKWKAKGGKINPTTVSFSDSTVTRERVDRSDVAGHVVGERSLMGGPDSASIRISGPSGQLRSLCPQALSRSSTGRELRLGLPVASRRSTGRSQRDPVSSVRSRSAARATTVRSSARAARGPAYMARFTDRVAVVTGAGSGLGRATARLFASEGAKVAVLDLATDAAEKVATELNGDGGDGAGVLGRRQRRRPPSRPRSPRSPATSVARSCS